MTPKERAAMQQALEALEMYNEHGAILRPLKTTNALREALAKQAEQEPVAWVEVERGIPMFMNFADDYKPNINNGIAPLYAAPVRTKDLTDDEIVDIWNRNCGMIDRCRAIIAADREKNRGTA